jgi:predicted RNA binding protein YcfA (HicA-like mRNA interferase family)/predicted RNase H-like HicB family nuclease
MKISEVLRLLEEDGWTLARTSHRHFRHPTKPGLVTVAGKPSSTLKPGTRSEHPEAGWSAKEGLVRGYVVIFEGDDETGHSAYSPDLAGVVAAGDSRNQTERPMRSAMADHIRLLKETGEAVPEPSDAADVMLQDPAAA